MSVAAPSAPRVRSTEDRNDRFRVSVAQYTSFRHNGYLVVPNLVSKAEVAELLQHTDDLMHGRLAEQKPGAMGEDGMGPIEAPPAHLSPREKADHFLRIHMLHRRLPLHERYMLHPRVLDVLEAIIGPDVLALQTMLFLKPPGKPGQGWHQDSYYIPTHPDSLCGAWIAIDECDEQNGAMWFAAGSGSEPIYPPKQGGGSGDRLLGDIAYVDGVSDVDDSKNDLARVADRYPQLLCTAKAGDVVFFNGHVLHRSKANFTTDRYRRSFVSHYCNARAYTQWGSDGSLDPIYGWANHRHILARGDTHMPFSKPRFGTPCAAMLTAEERRKISQFAMAVTADGADMAVTPANPNRKDDDDAPDAYLR